MDEFSLRETSDEFDFLLSLAGSSDEAFPRCIDLCLQRPMMGSGEAFLGRRDSKT